MIEMANDNGIPLLNQKETTLRVRQMSPSVLGSQQTRSVDDFGMPFKENRENGAFKLLHHIKSRQPAILNSLIHLPAVATTLGVLSLTFLNVFWEAPSGNTNVVLSSLQFAAQIHASLIVMSLSAMLLHLAHRGLSSQDGAPLGFLSSAFQLNSISYLFRRELTSLHIRYIAVFLVAFSLTLLSGPSSAITMIPRLQFWNVQKSWVDKGHVEFHVYMEANESSLYPDILTMNNAAPSCSLATASLLQECPSFGMRKWMADDQLFAIAANGAAPTINETIQEGWVRSLVGQGGLVNQGDSSLYLASTLSTFIGNALSAYSDLMGSFTSQVFGVSVPNTVQQTDDFLGRYDLSLHTSSGANFTRKPLVEVQCAGWGVTATALDLNHDRMVFPPWTTDPIFSTQWSIPASDFASLSVDNNATLINSSWINIEQFGSVKPSLGAYFVGPETFIGYCTDGESTCNYSQYTCTIDARWMPTHAILDGSSGQELIYDANPNPIAPAFYDLDAGPSPSAYPSVLISESWSQLLDVPWIDSITDPIPSNRTILDTIGQKCLDKNTFINATLSGRSFDEDLPHRITLSTMGMLGCLQVALSVYLADSIARAQNNFPTYFVASGHVAPSWEDSDFPADVFLVQDLYAGQVLQTGQTGRITELTQADFKDASRFTEIVMATSRYGYGYGFQDSKFAYLGTVVLLLHTVLCVVYVAWILGIGHRSAGWYTIGELVWVAMGSGMMDDRENPRRKWTDRFIVRKRETDLGNLVIRSENRMVLRRVHVLDSD